MEQDIENLNWYKASLLKIADEIGAPKAESSSSMRRVFKRSFGISIDKKSAIELESIINSTRPNTRERLEKIKHFLSANEFNPSDIVIMMSVLAPLE